MSDETLTVGEAVDAYRTLQGLRPQALSRALLDEVVDAAQALEPVAVAYEERVQKHAERIAPGADSMEEMTEAQTDELGEVVADLREEEADVEAVPTVDPAQAESVAAVMELRKIEALQPIYPSTNES
jgi:hypothetical protein